MVDHQKRAREIVDMVSYITIASVSADGEPWNSPVFAAHDGEYRFYWCSYHGTQHSQNIRATGRVFLAVYDSTVPVGAGECVYIKGTAKQLTDPVEIATARRLLQARCPVPWPLDDLDGDAPMRLYQAVPERIWMNGSAQVNGRSVDARIEVDPAP